MSSESVPAPLDQEIRFDTAADSAPAACAGCGQPIAASYFEADGAIVCPGCKTALETSAAAGSSSGRFGRALVFGLGGAAAGAALYYAILALTGYEIGLVAIAVGWLVGRAVHLGSRGRGGWLYQGLAVALTYVAIVSTYIPYVVEEIPGSDPGALLFLLIIAMAAPFFAGFRNVIGLLIIGFALYQAWRMNARTRVTFTGPYALGAPRPAADA